MSSAADRLRRLADELNQPEGTEKTVCNKILQRQKVGIKKYSTTLDDNPLSTKQWLNHLQEELMDGALYVERSMQNLDNLELIEWAEANVEDVISGTGTGKLGAEADISFNMTQKKAFITTKRSLKLVRVIHFDRLALLKEQLETENVEV